MAFGNFISLFFTGKHAETVNAIQDSQGSAAPRQLRRRCRILSWDVVRSDYLDGLLGELSGGLKSGGLHLPEQTHTVIREAFDEETEKVNKLTTTVEQDDDDTDHSEPSDDAEETETDYDEDEESRQMAEFVWGPFRSIPDERFVDLLHRLFRIGLTKDGSGYKVEKRTEGSFHHVVILSNGSEKMVIKVPMVGTAERWQRGHAAIIQSEADTMIHIKHKLPNFPIPDVYAYDVGFENEIGAPFMLLSYSSGSPANHIWFDARGDEEDDETMNNTPTEEREKLRINFLKSLAKAMAELRHLEFNACGMVYLQDNDPDKPVIGPYHGWMTLSFDRTRRKYWERPVFETAAEYYMTRLHEKFGSKYAVGISKILSMVYSSPPLSASKKHDADPHETFVLQHNDFDYQNILVSETGEITAILDWDGCGTVPRCAGYSNVPLFLQSDWQAHYDMSDPKTLTTWNLNKYRRVYSEAMIEACGGIDSDAKYTEQSALYAVIHDILFGENSGTRYRAEEFIAKLMHEIPLFRLTEKPEEFTKKLGDGWPEVEEALKEWIPRILARK
ncbi:uncharacterized protein EI97DRAFT_489551 [Westerdykella ornata]|uniref:Aminoglycoside phosphotransferase domain-containing protein n=1 Tax=Westerdykella ornata TaxID=318751 RepID=A0A6A6JK23_WESOR|nr:uncharacterized protein EI97DRAFT_489551 [Westerdykella ornata]KAF2276990.1 hypothetical protein EI97DRAFT_489551 [Westerdykella ornata]